MSTPVRIAILGATGNVGRALLTTLDERQFPVGEIYALASKKSAGRAVAFGDRELSIIDVATFDFTKVDLVLASAGAETTKEYAAKITDAGAIIVDNSSAFRMDEQVPLVVPEVNPGALDVRPPKGIVANPNCSTIQMVTALKPLHDAATITRIVVSTYQSVSGSGKQAMDELFEQTKGFYTTQTVEPAQFTKQIAFNVIPPLSTNLPL
ncbi:MAG: aspartate-semialdehyde dehydrogenase, partial [Alphaproteobacteria bacterium]|nr:aspartate-semialdehyde dehydrogenase [Alphaproteobacteria bacterium]